MNIRLSFVVALVGWVCVPLLLWCWMLGWIGVNALSILCMVYFVGSGVIAGAYSAYPTSRISGRSSRG